VRIRLLKRDFYFIFTKEVLTDENSLYILTLMGLYIINTDERLAL